MADAGDGRAGARSRCRPASVHPGEETRQAGTLLDLLDEWVSKRCASKSEGREGNAAAAMPHLLLSPSAVQWLLTWLEVGIKGFEYTADFIHLFARFHR